jgi:Rab3 GTPase-activating protein regulatory subunit N-terminus
LQIPIESIVDGTGNHSSSFQLVESVTDVSDFVVLPYIYSPGIFSLEGSSDAAHSLLVAADSDASLSMYNIGGKQQFQHLGKLGSYLKNQVSSAISKTFQSIFTLGTASSSADKGSRIKAASVALASLIDFEDPKRKVLRMKLDPSGELVAAADNLGRVTLYDIRLNVIVRLWKGVRDARLAFSSREMNSRVHTSLAIYAPQLGLLSFYAMKHGPCLRIVPIPCGSQCQIYTTVERSGSSSCR